MTGYTTEFELYLKGSKKASQSTIQSYTRDLGQFLAFFDGKHINSVADIDSAQIQKYLDSMSVIGRSKATVTRATSTIRTYFRFLVQSHYIDKNPAASIKSEKCEKKLPQVLVAKEIELLLAQPDTTELKGCRDKAMLEVLYATGIRVSELIALDVDDINLHIGVLYCRNSNHERIIPLYQEAIRVVSDYCGKVRNMIATDDEKALFTNMNGQRLTRQGFWKIVKQYAKSAGIEKDITPHTLRHSFAALLLENGAQLDDIKEMMGHSDISSTQVYAQLMKERFKDVYSNCHPKAKRR